MFFCYYILSKTYGFRFAKSNKTCYALGDEGIKIKNKNHPKNVSRTHFSFSYFFHTSEYCSMKRTEKACSSVFLMSEQFVSFCALV